MMDDIRKVTLSGIEHLTKEQLYNPPADGEYPIGSYLMHLAECEVFWLEVLSQTEQPADLKKKCFYNKWFDPSETPEPPGNPMELSEYVDILNQTSDNLKEYLSAMKDEELEEMVSIQGSTSGNKFSKKWIIYHLIEHEAHHRGQMFMLIRKAGWGKKKS